MAIPDAPEKDKRIILSGMRPTGELHLGNFEGVLRNWIELQNTSRCFYFVADWHALTSELDTRQIGKYSLDMVADWLAFGVDPYKSTLFIQSSVPEHAELSLILERLVNIGTLERLPTYKGYLEHLAGDRKIWEGKDENRNEASIGKKVKAKLLEGDERLAAIARAEVSLGFLAYPVLQAADILLYDTTHVPVGEDQLPHVELTREIARKFNRTYGELFVVPEVLLGEAKRIRGADGRKMSKSYDNELLPSYGLAEIDQRIRQTITNRPQLTSKGDPYECPVYDLQRIFNQEQEIEIGRACREASIGCFDCKMKLPGKITAAYESYRENRAKISEDYVKDVLREGNKIANVVAKEKMSQVKEMMLMGYLKR